MEDISYHGPLKILLYIKKKGRKKGNGPLDP
jgi:hypothetical protein